MSASTDLLTDRTSGDSILLREDCDGVVTLTLNRPAQYNALSGEMLDALQAALDDIDSEDIQGYARRVRDELPRVIGEFAPAANAAQAAAPQQ